VTVIGVLPQIYAMPLTCTQPDRREYRTSYKVWLILTVLLFVVAGFISLPGETKGDNRYWVRIAALFAGDYTLSTTEYLSTMALYTLFLAVPSIILSWVLQAVLVVAWSRVSAHRSVATEPQC
jgi:hypothetical protein